MNTGLKELLLTPEKTMIDRSQEDNGFTKIPDENQIRIEEVKTYKFFHETFNAFFWFVFNCQYLF